MMDDKEIKLRSLALINRLDPDDRESIILYVIEQLSEQEIADLLRVDVTTIGTRVEQAMRKLLSMARDKKLREYIQGIFIGIKPSINLIETIELVKQLTPDLIGYLRHHEDDLQKLPFDVFEHLVGEFLAQRGFDEVKLVGREADTSADILAVHRVQPIDSEVRYFVEVKRWKDRVGIEVINAVYGAMIMERPYFGWHAAMIVSLAGFKRSKKLNSLRLSSLNVVLKEKEDLLRWLREYEPRGSGLWLPKANPNS
jgi:DNA-binding CsgD family transcriptional regulator